jgi:hypothetical protein
MATIITRAGKGSPLTHNEVDANFTNLNTDKLEASDLTAGTGISIAGTTITNAAPDQTVSITGSGIVSVSGTYPNFEVAATALQAADIGVSVQAYDANLTSFVSAFTLPTTDGTAGQVLSTDGAGNLTLASTGTVTSVAASAGTGISISGSPITSSGTLVVTNTAPDQTVVLTAGENITVTGTYPSFTIAASVGGSVSSRVRLNGSGTYTVPAGVSKIRVFVVGGGGGGCPFSGTGGTGGTSSFGAISAGGGVGSNNSVIGRGGTGGGTGCNGNGGGAPGDSVAGSGGGSGGFGGGGGDDGVNGTDGGGGAGASGQRPGGGGGGLHIAEISTTPGSTFSYSSGAGGSSGAGNGGAGFIIVEF